MAGDPKPSFTPLAGRLTSDVGIKTGGQAQSKYDVGSRYNQSQDLNALRAERQGFWDGLGNMSVNILATVAGQAIGSIGSLSDGLYNMVMEDNLKVNEGIVGLGSDLVEGAAEMFPNYVDPNRPLGIGSIGDYLAHGAPNFASAAAMLLPGMGLAKGLGVAARAGRLGELGSQLLMRGGGAAAMRHAENTMEAAGVYNSMMKEWAEGTNPQYDGFDKEDMEKAANLAAKHTYNSNWVNIVFDVFQLGAVLKPLKGIGSWTTALGKQSRFAQVMDYGMEAATKKGFMEGAGKWAKAGIGTANFLKPVIGQVSEGVEEMWNYVSEQEGRHEGNKALGMDDGSTKWERFQKYMGDAKMWESGAWGVAGGVGFQMGGDAIQKAGAKRGWWEDTSSQAMIIESLNERGKIIKKSYADLQDPNLTDMDKEIVKSQMVFDLVKSNKQSDTLDMLEEDLKNPKMLKKFSETMGMKEEDARGEIVNLLEDIKYINEQIDTYVGATAKSWLGQKRSFQDTNLKNGETKGVTEDRREVPFKDSTALTPYDEYHAEDAEAAEVEENADYRINRTKRNSAISDTFQRNPFNDFVEPGVAMQLAYNDYKLRVLNRQNDAAQKELVELTDKLFTGDLNTPNMKAVFNLHSDGVIIEELLKHEKNGLKEAEEKGYSENKKKLIKDTVDRYEKRQAEIIEELKGVKAIMDSDSKLGVSGKTFSDAIAFANTALESQPRFVDVKSRWLGNQQQKHTAIETNKQILNSPKSYLKEDMENNYADIFFETRKKEKEKRELDEKQAILDEMNAMVKEDNPEYKAAYEKHLKDLESALAKYTDTDTKIAYLNKEVNLAKDAILKAKASGKFPQHNKEVFDKDFDKALWIDLKARESAGIAKLKEIAPEVAKAAAATAAPTTTGSTVKTSSSPVVKPSVLKMTFEEGTPGYYYKGLLTVFGEDGKKGTFGNILKSFNNHIAKLEIAQKNFPILQKALESYQAADKAGDPNKDIILTEALASVGETIDKGDTALYTLQTLMAVLENNITSYTKNLNPKTPVIETSYWNSLGMVVFGKYPDVQEFIEPIVSKYVNLGDLVDNMADVQALIDAEMAKAKEAYEGKKTETEKEPSPTADPVTDEAMDVLMDRKPEDEHEGVEVISDEDTDLDSREEGDLFVGNYARSATAYETKPDGSSSKTYIHNKQIPSKDFNTANTVMVLKDNKVTEAFVEPGNNIMMVYTGRDYRGEKEVILYKVDAAGNMIDIGFMDKASRLKSSIATLKNKLKLYPKAKAETKQKWSDHIHKYEALIPFYNKIRSSLSEAGDNINGTIERVRFGSVITTAEDKHGRIPININSAFDLSTINRKASEVSAPVIFGVYYGDQFITKVDDSNVNVANIHSIEIPESQKNIKTRTGKGTNNGSIFALLPTNTFGTTGKRIYLPYKLATSTISSKALTTTSGQTIPEVMLDVLFDPDKRRNEFMVMADRLGIPFKKEFPISSPENRQSILAMFTTSNLLKLFNDITFVYDSNDAKSRAIEKNYSWHIGLNVRQEADKDGNINPYIRFDLSTSTSEKNTYAVTLFDKEGNFAPFFGSVERPVSALIGKEAAAGLGALAEVKQVVKVKDELATRFRQKKARVDIKKVSGTTSSGPYKTIVLDKGELVEKEFPSYLHYLDAYGILQSTVHGIDIEGTNNDGKPVKSRTYFGDQSFWITTDGVVNKAEEKKKEAKTTTKTSTSKPGPTVSKKEPTEKKKEPVVSVIKEHKPTKVTGYLSIPNRDGSFTASALSVDKKSDSSMYEVEDIGGGRISVSFLNDARAVKDATSSPELVLLPIVKQMDALNQKTSKITTTKPAIFRKEGDRYVLESRAEVYFSEPTLSSKEEPAPKAKEGTVLKDGTNYLADESTKIERPTDKRNTYRIDGVEYQRVSDAIGSPYKMTSGNTSTKAGTAIDKYLKDYFDDAAKLDTSGLEHIVIDELHPKLEAFKDGLKRRGEKIVATGVVVFGKIDGKKIAGEVDMLTVDEEGNFNIYDFKTSFGTFDDKSYNAPINGKWSAAVQHQRQLSTYAQLIQQMVGEPVGFIAVIPITISYNDSTKKVDSAMVYETKFFEDILDNPIPKEEGTASTTTATESELTEEDIIEDDDIVTGSTSIVEKKKDTFMADEPVSPEMLMAMEMREQTAFIDPSHFRDYSRNYGEQRIFEEYTSQLVLDYMYNNYMTNNNDASTYGDILIGIQNLIDKKVTTFTKIIDKGGIVKKINGTIQLERLPEAELKAMANQLKYYKELNKYLDMDKMDDDAKLSSNSFIGYARTAIMNIKQNGIVNVDIINDDVTINTASDVSYTARFQDNYAFKINPKASVRMDMRIFLSRIPELERTKTEMGYEFKYVANPFGVKKYYNMGSILQQLHIEFENVDLSNFYEKIKDLDTRVPYLHSIVNTLSDIKSKDANKENKIYNQLSQLVQQRRDMKYIDAKITDKGTKVSIRDAARQGITQNIIKEWENRFRQNFKLLFDVNETEDKLEATAAKQNIDFNTTKQAWTPELPEYYSNDTQHINWQREWFYNALKNMPAGRRLKLDFANGKLIVDGKKTILSKVDIARMVLLMDSNNLSVDESLKPLFEELQKETKLQQIKDNLKWLTELKTRYSGDANEVKDASGYHPLYYMMMADQFNRLGIQLAEDPDMSWTVLQDLNKKNGDKRTFNMYDNKVDTFKGFMNNIIENLIVGPLEKKDVFSIKRRQFIDEKTNLEEVDADTAELDIENPFSRSLKGLVMLAKHSRIEWGSFANETIRNVNGDLEYTYTAQNALNISLNKIKNTNSNHLQNLLQTPTGRFNPYLQRMLADPAYRNALTLHYIDGGKVNNRDAFSPENLNAGTANLISWNMYYNNETKTAERGQGGYITTHSDSTIMPVFMFDKQRMDFDMVTVEKPDGSKDFEIRLKKGTTMYENLYSAFRGEIQRIIEVQSVYKDIKNQPEEEQLEYAIQKYQQFYEFNIKDGKVIPGNGMNLYKFGNTNFYGNSSGIYLNDDKTELKRGIIDGSGNINEENITELFDTFGNRHINELISDSYNEIKNMGDAFYSINEVGKGTKRKLDIKFKSLNGPSVTALRDYFDNNITIDNVASNYYAQKEIGSVPTKESLLKKGSSEEEAEQIIDMAEAQREKDLSEAIYPEAFLKFLVADKAINYHLFHNTILDLLIDPAIIKKSTDYIAFKDELEKRLKGEVSPGTSTIYSDKEPVKVIGFKDVKLNHIKKTFTAEERATLTELEQTFLNEFEKNIGTTDGKFPLRVLSLSAFYWAMPKGERHKAWDVIKGVMKSETTDGGSYISTKEWLYRLLRQGKITKQDYFDYLDYFKTGNGKKPIPGKLLKYVYGGNNIMGAGDIKSNIYFFIKHAEIPLLPGMFEGTALDEIRKQVEAIEDREYSGYAEGEPTPGILLAPESAIKSGFSSISNLYDEDGNPTVELSSARVFNLNRGFLREQLQMPDKDHKRSIISSQANVLMHNNIPFNWRFGRRGNIIISHMNESDQLKNEEGEIDNDDSGSGINNHTIEKVKYMIFTSIANRRFEKMIDRMGINVTGKERSYIVESVEKFLSHIRNQAANRFGLGSNAMDYLHIDSIDRELAIPITFSPAAKQLQAVLMSEFKDMFYRFQLPGGSFAQFSSTGLHTYDGKAGNIQVREDLKGYRPVTKMSKAYINEEAARKDFNEEEINKVIKLDNGKVKIEYFEYEPAECIIPWVFKDAEGKALDFNKYCNKDGSLKQEINQATGKMEALIDPALLDIVGLRIPNTGANSMAKMKVVKFLNPVMNDGIAVAPEIMAILGADFDYDKLYTYIYNYTVGPDGRISKVGSVIHSNQNDTENFFLSDEPKSGYADRMLESDNEYMGMKDKLQRLIKGENPDIDLQEEMQEVIKATKQKFTLEDLKNLKKEGVSNNEIEKLQAAIEKYKENFIKSPAFNDSYNGASLYDKQSVEALENGLIDTFHLMLGDFKMLKNMTSLLSTDWLQGEVNKEISYIDKNGKKQKKSMLALLHGSKYHSITSYTSYMRSRLSNASADQMIGIMANVQIALYQGQRFSLSLNGSAYGEDYNDMYIPRFLDKDGKLKDEEGMMEDDNITNYSRKSPYTAKSKKRKSTIYTVPNDSRYRLDRVYTIDNAGNKVQISLPVQSALQASLDHQKNPLIDKAFLNPKTSNAYAALLRLGYIDEAIPLLNQEVVFDYVQSVMNYYDVTASESRTMAMLKTVKKYGKSMGITEDIVDGHFKELEKEHKNGIALITSILSSRGVSETVLSVADLEQGIAQRAGVATKGEDYGLKQLLALREFLIADKIGTQLFSIQQSSNAYSKGLKSTFAEMELQRIRFNNLFDLEDKKIDKVRTERLKSSVPLIAGVHRMMAGWSGKMNEGHMWRNSMMAFAQYHGVMPTNDLLKSAAANGIFYEMSPFFTEVRARFMKISMGKYNLEDLEGISNADFERIFNKMNVNIVSFMFSNPDLYISLFKNANGELDATSIREFDVFREQGLEMLTRASTELPYDKDFRLFNKPESIAAEIDRISKTINASTGKEYGQEYDILSSLKPLFTVTGKTPSSLTYITSTAYQDNINHRLALSIADMYSNGNHPELQKLARRLVMYGFMTGGIVQPYSFIQFIPPSILRDMGFDKVLRNSINMLQGNENGITVRTANTMIMQYFQHNPFELKAEVKDDDLVLTNDKENPYLHTDKEYGAYIEIHKTSSSNYTNKWLLRKGDRIYRRLSNNSKKYIQLDKLGMAKWHRNEYKFNMDGQPGSSLYQHNKTEGVALNFTGLELGGQIKGYSDISEEAEDGVEAPLSNMIGLEDLDEVMDYSKEKKRTTRPFIENLKELMAQGGGLIIDLVDIMNYSKDHPLQKAALSLQWGYYEKSKLTFKFQPLPVAIKGKMTEDGIIINSNYPGFNPERFDEDAFFEFFAHESTHMVTLKMIKEVLDGTEKNPARKQAIKRLQRLHAQVIKHLEKDSALSKEYEKFIKFKKTWDKVVIEGKKLTEAERKYLYDNSLLRGFHSPEIGDNEQEAEIRQLAEFIAYANSNEDFQKMLNKIDLRKATLWEKFIEALLEFFGIDITEDEANDEIKKIKKGLIPKGFKYEFKDNEWGRESVSDDLHSNLTNLEAYSALHVALREIIGLTREVKTQSNAERIRNNMMGITVKLDNLYRGVPNYDPTWPSDIKNKYHQAASNGEIIC